MSESTWEDPCSFPVLCTRPPGPDESAGAESSTSTSVVTHNINNDSGTSFTGVPIKLYKTVRTFNMGFSMVIQYGGCGETTTWNPGGSVSESCVHENSILYYTNIKAGVCLYKRVSTDINFSADCAGMVWYRSHGTWSCHARSYFLPVVAADALEEWILIKDGTAVTLSSYHIPGSYNGRTIGIVAPTPDPYFAVLDPAINPNHPLLETGVYNSYELCMDGGPNPNSFTALDGTEIGDMFFPEWCRDRVVDPLWTQAAADLYTWCSQNMTEQQMRDAHQARTFSTSINHSSVPIGDYVIHPTRGEAYSFMLSAERTSPSNIVIANKLGAGVPETVLAAVLEAAKLDPLSVHTIFYPMSLI